MLDQAYTDLIESVPLASIDVNAATVTFLATNNFSGIAASGVAGVNSTNVGFTVGPAPAFDCTVIVTVVVACHQSAGSGTGKIMIGYQDTGAFSGYTYSTPEVQVTGTTATYTLQGHFNHSAANGTCEINLGWDSTSTTNVLTMDEYETFQVEYIKR